MTKPLDLGSATLLDFDQDPRVELGENEFGENEFAKKRGRGLLLD